MHPLSRQQLPQHKALDRRIEHALETAPEIPIPPGFAARIAALVPEPAPLPSPRFTYGRNSVFVCAAVLLVVLLLLAPHVTATSVFANAIEWFLCAQLSVLALLALPGSPLRSVR